MSEVTVVRRGVASDNELRKNKLILKTTLLQLLHDMHTLTLKKNEENSKQQRKN